MRVDVGSPLSSKPRHIYTVSDAATQDPEIQKVTGEADPVKVMTKLREMKNNFK